MSNPEHYTYRVIWAAGDTEFVGLCAEFRSLSWLAESQQEALNGIVELVRTVVLDMAEEDEKIPKPISHRKNTVCWH